MDFLKKFFFLSFKMSKSVGSFVAGIIICVVAPAVLGVVDFILCIIPYLGLLISLVTTPLMFIFGLYCTASLVFLILDFCKVFDKKDGAIETTAEEVVEETPAE